MARLLVAALLIGLAWASTASAELVVRSPAQKSVNYRKARELLIESNRLHDAAVAGTSNDAVGDTYRASALRWRAKALAEATQEGSTEDPRAESSAQRHDEQLANHTPDASVDALFQHRIRASGPRSKAPVKARSPWTAPTLTIAPTIFTGESAARAVERARSGQAFAAHPFAHGRESMIRSRDFATVDRLLGKRFGEHLQSMGPDDVWIDVGTGQGNAPADFLARDAERKPRVIGIDLRGDAKHLESRVPAGRFTSIEGDVRALPLPKHVGLITDVYGAMSYTDRPDDVLRAYGHALRPGGRLMMLVSIYNVVIDSDGKASEKLVDYLGRIPGFEVETLVPLNVGTVVNLRRTDAELEIPSLEMVDAIDHGPPHRTFRVIEGKGPGSVKGPGAFERYKDDIASWR